LRPLAVKKRNDGEAVGEEEIADRKEDNALFPTAKAGDNERVGQNS